MSNRSYGPPSDGDRDPHPSFGTRFDSGAYNRAPYDGDSYGDSSYRHSSSYGNYGNLGQSFAVGDDQASFGSGGSGGSNRAEPGDLVADRYQLVDLVGKGGNGSVWRATDMVLRREVALKEVFLPPHLPPDERVQLIGRSRREAEIAAGLSHPSVIRVFDVVEHSGLPWIVMELLQARSLAEILTQDGPLHPRVVAKIGLALVGALQAAHDAGIIHRDVKPGNVLISTDGRCVLSDFGAAQLNQTSGGTTPGKVLGSAHYIAPERAVGHPAETASDVFSLGVTLYAAAEGRPPFDRGDAVSTMRAVVMEPPESPRNAGPLTMLLGGMLAKDPQERYPLAQVRQELASLLAGPLSTPVGNSGAMPAAGTPIRTESDVRGQTSGYQEVEPPRRPRLHGPEPEPPEEGKGKRIAIVAICVLLVLTLGYGIWRWQFADNGGDAADPSASESGPAEDDAATDGATEGEAETPAFETTAHEGDGFSVNYPAAWGEGAGGDDYATYYNTEDETQWVRFYFGSDRALPDTEAYLSDYYDGLPGDMTDLERVRLEAVEFGGMSGTVLEYTGTNRSDEAERHSIWAIVDAGDGTSYGVFISGDADAWDLSQGVYEEALRSFATG